MRAYAITFLLAVAAFLAGHRLLAEHVSDLSGERGVAVHTEPAQPLRAARKGSVEKTPGRESAETAAARSVPRAAAPKKTPPAVSAAKEQNTPAKPDIKISVSARKKGPLIVYSSRDEELLSGALRLFTERTGIAVKVKHASAAALIARLGRSAAAGADVFLAEDVVDLEAAKTAGVLGKVSLKSLRRAVPKGLRDSKGYWFGLSKRVRAIFYADGKAEEGDITRYSDLGKSQWRDALLTGSLKDPLNRSLIAAAVADRGEKKARRWVEAVAKNRADAPDDGTERLRLVAAGQGAVTVADIYSYVKLFYSGYAKDLAVAESVRPVFPDDSGRGAHVNITGAGVTANAVKRKEAVKLLKFLVSEEGQRVYSYANFELPAVKKVAPFTGIAALGDFRENIDSVRDIPRYASKAEQLAREAGWN